MDARDLVGASFLIGMTFVDQRGSERKQAYVGRVRKIAVSDSYESVDDGSHGETMTIECHDRQTREFPFEPSAIEVADPGFYELPDGATIEDLHYEMHWRIKEPAKH